MAMTVRQLMEELEQYDPDAQVLMMQQPSWPFEYSIEGVTQRWMFDEELATDDAEDRDDRGTKRGSDVFLLEGTQLRYGSKNAW